MEQIRSLLQQEVETRTQKIVTAKKEGQSEESLRPLYDQAQFFAEKLSKLEQPAVTSHEGRSEQLVAEVRNDGAVALDRACKQFKAQWQQLWSRPSTYAYSKCS
ncbi:hypothetical protein WJX82_006211 [Trebouxia sp. C0006]